MRALQSLSKPVREPVTVSLSEQKWMGFYATQLLDTGCPEEDVMLHKSTLAEDNPEIAAKVCLLTTLHIGQQVLS